MLYDPNWKPIEVPIEVPPRASWRQILIDAAQVISKRGWFDSDFQENESGGAVCAIGAFRVVQHGDGSKRHSPHPKYGSDDLKLAKRKFWAAIPREQKDYLLNSSLTEKIIHWNDDRCKSKKTSSKYFCRPQTVTDVSKPHWAAGLTDNEAEWAILDELTTWTGGNSMSQTIDAPPNELERIDTIWAILSTDATGEGLCGTNIGDRWMTLTVGNERLVEKVLIPIAQDLAKLTGKKLKLVKFNVREEIKEFGP